MALPDETVYVLVHSPLAGGLTWTLVAQEMLVQGLNALVPHLSDQAAAKQPFWKQHVESILPTLSQIPAGHSVTLVGHSGAGPLLPVIAQALDQPIKAYLFVDASLPRDGASRLALMKREDPAWAEQLQQALQQGQQYPTWTEDDLRDIVPNAALRRDLVAEIKPRSLSFFSEPIPVFAGWPDAPCTYLKFSAPYNRVAAQARQAGWLVRHMDAGHFHMLVDPEAVTEVIMEIMKEIT